MNKNDDTFEQITDGLNELHKLIPNKSYMQLLLIIQDRILEQIISQVDNELLLKAINYALKIPEFLIADTYWDGNSNEIYYLIKENKILKKDLYSFRIVGKKRKRTVFKYLWEEYKDTNDIINKCCNKNN